MLILCLCHLQSRSVQWLTDLKPDGLNKAKASFEQIPRTANNGEAIDAGRVDGVISEGQLSTKSSRLIKKNVNCKEDGAVSFGEYARLVRGGTEGLLPPRDVDILNQGLMSPLPSAQPMSARPSVPVPELWKGVPEEDVLDALHESFTRHDVEKTSVVPWKEVHPIAADMVTGLDLAVDPELAARSLKRIPDAPTNVLHREVDLEDW